MFNLLKQGIMKRVFKFRTILAIAVSLLFANGLSAQTPIPGWDNGAGGDNYDATANSYVIVGSTIPLYADPDPYYHPAYDPTDGSGLNAAGFTWVWTSADEPANITFGGAADNYLEVTGVNAGAYTVNVAETAPAAWGSCADAGQNITVNVVAVPAIAYEAVLAAGNPYEECSGSASLPAAITSVISGGYQAYRLAWNLEIKTLTSGGADKDFYDTDKITVIIPPVLAEEYTQAVPEAVAAIGNHDITSIAGGFTVIDVSTTVYTYTLQGLNDQASRWSDFLTLAGLGTENTATAGDFTYYDTADDVLTVTVHPSPTTGPIYHIATGWAN